ncbi:M56 family metallopeptidase [Dyadobacter luticola]|uniref:TonB family protein n=1 Tax=Dyadobacter luticola TaxID=1979387 RepID=A0A5R9KPM7_9BACT|nr:M56 family metallopeptidase [Dyadobacter luticola]TLU98183.1 TonB family protein [Dyadobacter luticola]
MDTIIYFAKVNLYWVMLYACYWLMLRNHTFFRWNRYYLLGSLCIAFTLPFVIYPATAPVLPVTYEITASTFTLAPAEAVDKPWLTWVQALWIVYGIGFTITAGQFIKHFIQLKNFLRAGELIELEDCKVVLIDSNQIGSFSFLKWIVINRNDYENHFDAILRHEMVHTQQWHSLDILFTEIMKVVFWFNPVLRLYKNAFQEIHEFLADEQAPNRESYARFLVAYALNAPVASLTNHFFKPSQIKSRIKMIYKNRTSKWMLSTYVVAAMLIGTAAILVAGCENSDTKDIVDTKPLSKEALANKPIFTVVEEQPEFPGGQSAMFEFLAKNIKYPAKAARANVSGRVFLSFIVTETGETGDIKVLKGIGFDCDEEAIRVLSKFPKWTPGKQNGHPVNVRYNLPINFQLDDSDDSAMKTGVKINSEKPKPLYVIDGKVTPEEDASKIASANIKSVNVLRDESAVKLYGQDGKNGVLEISTRDINKHLAKSGSITISDNNPSPEQEAPKLAEVKPGLAPNAQVMLRGNMLSSSEPLVIIDGEKQEERGKAGFEKLNPDDIKAVTVLKNQNAISAYGEEGRSGVVLITTKK